jgi:hypothetical protein
MLRGTRDSWDNRSGGSVVKRLVRVVRLVVVLSAMVFAADYLVTDLGTLVQCTVVAQAAGCAAASRAGPQR